MEGRRSENELDVRFSDYHKVHSQKEASKTLEQQGVVILKVWLVDRFAELGGSSWFSISNDAILESLNELNHWLHRTEKPLWKVCFVMFNEFVNCLGC